MDSLERRTREIVRQNGFIVHNHMELEAVEPGRAVFRMEILPNSTNGYGMVHGGALFSLADNAAGCAAHSDGRSHVTQTASLNYIANQSRGVIRAEGRVRHRGRKTALVSVDITGEGGRLLATGEFIYYCVSEDG